VNGRRRHTTLKRPRRERPPVSTREEKRELGLELLAHLEDEELSLA
jgi:hypothetical protein